jgi:hypothetical protein
MPGRAEFATEFASAVKRGGNGATAGVFTTVAGGGVLGILLMSPVCPGEVPGFTFGGLEGILLMSPVCLGDIFLVGGMYLGSTGPEIFMIFPF